MSNRTYADDLFPQELMETGESRRCSASSPNSVDAANSRIQVGWAANRFEQTENMDRQVAPYCTKLGESKYSFVVYPVGGVKRAFWERSKGGTEHPPVIDLPDVQLANSLWETYINGKISPWIDCDSEDERFAALSEEQLLKELNYVCYLGLQTMTLELKRISSPRTSALLHKWTWTKNARFTIWIQLPSSVEKCLDFAEKQPGTVDLWTIWADFRREMNNFSGMYLQVALTIPAELPDELIERKLAERWKAEPLAAFFVESTIFTTGKSGEAELPGAHVELLQELWSTDAIRFVLLLTSDAFKYNASLKIEYSTALRHAVRDVGYRRHREVGERDSSSSFLNVGEYKDVLQAPLQPLSENLDSGVYNTFEQDQMKYDVYGEAVEGALKDLGADGRKYVVVYLLGGGRGPIGTKILRAEKNYNATFRASGNSPMKVKLYIVEKNPNAIVTLKFMNTKSWKRRVTIVESDMRSLPGIARDRGFEQPDIIVSELLGSFGDNELSPECLDGVTDFLKPTTISIPQKYTSYVGPIMSSHLHQAIRGQSIPFLSRALPSHGRREPEMDEDGSWVQKFPQGAVQYNMDQIYVVFLSKFIPLSETTKPVFSFVHPNFENSTNQRSARVEFEMDRAADMMGFGGYFDLQLYKNVMLSIEPATQTKGMMSWFPAVIPLREQLRVAEGDRIALLIERKVDATGVWYEWMVEKKSPNGDVVRTPLQNPEGESYYMRM